MKNLFATTSNGLVLPVTITYNESFMVCSSVEYSGKTYECSLSRAKKDGNFVDTIEFKSYSKFIKENFPKIKTNIHVVLNTEYQPIVNEIKKDQIELWKKEALNIELPEILTLEHHSSRKWCVLNKEIPTHLKGFHPILSNIDELNRKDFTPTKSGYDDYSSWDLYEIPSVDVVSAIQESLKVADLKQIEVDHKNTVSKRLEEKRLNVMLDKAKNVLYSSDVNAEHCGLIIYKEHVDDDQILGVYLVQDEENETVKIYSIGVEIPDLLDCDDVNNSCGTHYTAGIEYKGHDLYCMLQDFLWYYAPENWDASPDEIPFYELDQWVEDRILNVTD